MDLLYTYLNMKHPVWQNLGVLDGFGGDSRWLYLVEGGFVGSGWLYMVLVMVVGGSRSF